uniref:Uncharacterized protein n=1 Tax=Arundo donax TaxID=35708 RepID=A0A0A9G2H6_ARUDO
MPNISVVATTSTLFSISPVVECHAS